MPPAGWINPAPPKWLEKQVATGMTVDEAKQMWTSATAKYRGIVNECLKRKRKTVDAAKARFDAGARDSRTMSVIQNGGWRSHATPEAAAAANRESMKAADMRKLADILEFRLLHATACSVDGCPIQPTEEARVPFCFLEHIHINPAERKGYVTHMPPSLREKEVENTATLCLWHHFAQTRERRGFTPAGQRGTMPAKELGALKIEAGCQHPLHDTMSYAPLFSAADPRAVGFFEVSHLRRGGAHKAAVGDHRMQIYLSDLASGDAVVHCSFCHALWTQCERIQIHPCTPNSVHQDELLRRCFPAFVSNFEEVTAGSDWEAAAAMSKRSKKQ